MLVTKRRVAAASVARHLSSRVIQFMHPHFLSLLCHYDQDIIADFRWVLIERDVRGANNVVTRLPFGMTMFFDFFKTSVSDEQIFETRKARLSGKHEVDGNFNLHISCDARLMVKSLSIYVVTFLCFLLGNLLTTGNNRATGFDAMRNSLTHDKSATLQTGKAPAHHVSEKYLVYNYTMCIVDFFAKLVRSKTLCNAGECELEDIKATKWKQSLDTPSCSSIK